MSDWATVIGRPFKLENGRSSAFLNGTGNATKRSTRRLLSLKRLDRASTEMQILQLLGILVILNTLTCAGWFVLQGKQLSPGIVSVIAVSVVSGLVLTFRGRPGETAAGENPKIKLVQQQVETETRQLASLKEQIQTQSVALESVTRESAEARRLLDSLNQANQKMEDRFRLLAEKTDVLSPVPADQTVVAVSPNGASGSLQETRTRMMQSYEQKNYEATYQAAKSCIRIFEETRGGKPGASESAAPDLSADEIAVLYGIGAEMALRMADNNQAVEWARKGVSASPSAEGKFTLVAALCGAEKSDQARKIVDETLSHRGQEADKFKALLHESGLIKVQN